MITKRKRTLDVWLAYSTDTLDEMVKEHFERKYGYPPEKVKRDRGCVRAGPIRRRCHDCDGSGYVSDGMGSGEFCGCNGQ